MYLDQVYLYSNCIVIKMSKLRYLKLTTTRYLPRNIIIYHWDLRYTNTNADKFSTTKMLEHSRELLRLLQ